MKKKFPSLYIEEEISVNDEDIQESEKIQNNPQKMLELVDLIFLCSDLQSIPS